MHKNLFSSGSETPSAEEYSKSPKLNSVITVTSLTSNSPPQPGFLYWPRPRNQKASSINWRYLALRQLVLRLAATQQASLLSFVQI